MPANQTVNGNSYSFVQIELYFGILPIAGIKDISYDDDLKRGDVYGTGSIQIGLTRGTYKANGSVEFYKNAFVVGLINQLGPGWRQQTLSAVVSYGPNDNGQVIQDTLPQILIGKVEASNQQGDDGPPLTNKVALYVPIPVLWNGVPSVIETFPTIAVA